MPLNPRFPLYIPTKGRHEYMVTSKALTAIGARHFLVVEPQQAADYARAVAKFKLLADVLVMDLTFKDRYELCDNLGLTKSTGPGPARNFAWQHAIENGHAWHWVMDDNIEAFYRLNHNLKVPVSDATIFYAMEDWALRYRNVAMVGPNYFRFAARKSKMPPIAFNTRIYSCNLIRNDVPHRWRGRYNEDTIMSLDMLKAGWCTAQFNAFLQEKMDTQVLPGGNTAEFYLAEGQKRGGSKYADTGTIAKSEMLVRVHPDVSKMAFRFKRWHHHVDYSPFKTNRLIKRDDAPAVVGVENFGMSLKKIKWYGTTYHPHRRSSREHPAVDASRLVRRAGRAARGHRGAHARQLGAAGQGRRRAICDVLRRVLCGPRARRAGVRRCHQQGRSKRRMVGGCVDS